MSLRELREMGGGDKFESTGVMGDRMSWNVIPEMTSGHPCAMETLREGVLLSWDPYRPLHMISIPLYLDICGPFLPHPSLLPLRASQLAGCTYVISSHDFS